MSFSFVADDLKDPVLKVVSIWGLPFNLVLAIFNKLKTNEGDSNDNDEDHDDDDKDEDDDGDSIWCVVFISLYFC